MHIYQKTEPFILISKICAYHSAGSQKNPAFHRFITAIVYGNTQAASTHLLAQPCALQHISTEICGQTCDLIPPRVVRVCTAPEGIKLAREPDVKNRCSSKHSSGYF